MDLNQTFFEYERFCFHAVLILEGVIQVIDLMSSGPFAWQEDSVFGRGRQRK